MLRTKIVCTIGPASREESVLRQMIQAGMNVARINFSHGEHAEHERNIALIRRLSEEEGRAIAIIADLQGPKFRVGEIAGDNLNLENGQEIILTTRPALRSTGRLPGMIRASLRAVDRKATSRYVGSACRVRSSGKSPRLCVKSRCRAVSLAGGVFPMSKV